MIRKLDLRTGRPVWFAYRAPRVVAKALTRDAKADVLVIGMGISGAMIAEALAADGHDVIAIDRRGPMLGSTPATTALILFEIDQPLSLLAAKIGREKAQRAWRRSRLTLQALRDRILELGIDCGLADRASLYLAGTTLDAAGLRAEAEARREAGLTATYLPPAALKDRFGIVRKGAILSPGSLALDPRKLTAGMLRAAAHRGARLYAPVEATALNESRDEIAVETRDGPTIRAKHVVLATGYELLKPVPGAHHRIISTWAIATRPQRRAYPTGEPMIWEASDPYLYIRTTADGRIVCGGEDEDFADDERRDALNAAKTERLSKKLAALLPGVDSTPEYAWSGSFGTTADGLPFAGRVPRHPRLFAAMGYGGNGITWSQLASEIVRTTLGGGADADASLFGFRN